MNKRKTEQNTIKAARLLLCLIMVCTLTACGSDELKGSYRSQGLVAQTFTFDDNEVTMSAFGMNASGTYEVREDKIYITYTLFGKEHTWSQPFSRTDDGFTISGTEFKKE